MDFEAHARAMGANTETVESIAGLEEAFGRARASDRTYVISLKTDAFEGWTGEGHAWWEVGLPRYRKGPKCALQERSWMRARKRQRVGV